MNLQGNAAMVQPRYDQSMGPTVRNSAAPAYTEIKKISPYISRWTIRGRCTVKSEKRHFNSKGRAGCVFNFDLTDKSGEVRCVAFSEVAEKFYDSIAVGKCYTLTKGTAKLMEASKRKWNQTGHDCEITLENGSIVRSSSLSGRFFAESTPFFSFVGCLWCQLRKAYHRICRRCGLDCTGFDLFLLPLEVTSVGTVCSCKKCRRTELWPLYLACTSSLSKLLI
jgi:hypothetical protein